METPREKTWPTQGPGSLQTRLYKQSRRFPPRRGLQQELMVRDAGNQIPKGQETVYKRLFARIPANYLQPEICCRRVAMLFGLRTDMEQR